MALSTSSEDYLKAIWKINEWQKKPASSGQLAKALELSPSTVSEGVARLVSLGLVQHAPYGAVRLTEDGRQQAARMVRTHRLIETGLVEILGYSWDEVHEEAEHLEHAVSDLFVERLDLRLGHPSRDPHGDLIPHPDEFVAHTQTPVTLAHLSAGATAHVERVSDKDSELLVHLKEAGIAPGITLTVQAVSEADQRIDIVRDGANRSIPLAAAAAVIVTQER